MKKIKILALGLIAFLPLVGCNQDNGGNTGGGQVSSDTVTMSSLGFTNEQVVTSFTANGYSITVAKGSSNNDPKYYASSEDLRLYAGNTLTISGGNLTSLSFSLSNKEGAFSASTGTVNDTNTSSYWTGSASSLTLTVDSGQRRIKSMTFGGTGTGGTTGDSTGGNTGGGEVSGGTVTMSSIGFTNEQVVTSFTANGYSITVAKGSGSNDPKYYANTEDLRLYAGNTLTISGGNLTSLSFGLNSKEGAFSASTGTVNDTNTSSSWTGSASSLKLTVASGQRRIKSMTFGGTGTGGSTGGNTGGTTGGTTNNAVLTQVLNFLSGRGVTRTTLPGFNLITTSNLISCEVHPDFEEDYAPRIDILVSGNIETNFVQALQNAGWEVDDDNYEEYGYECYDAQDEVEIDVMGITDPEDLDYLGVTGSAATFITVYAIDDFYAE